MTKPEPHFYRTYRKSARLAGAELRSLFLKFGKNGAGFAQKSDRLYRKTFLNDHSQEHEWAQR